MSIDYFRSLLFKSVQIQEEIEKEHKHRWPDGVRLRKLKKLRLAVKDRMEWLFHGGGGGKKLQPVRVKASHRS